VVLSRQIVHSAFWLAGCFAAVAGLYLVMGSDFLAAIQLVVYVGAIAVLFLFAIMLTRGVGRDEGPTASRLRWWALLTVLPLAGLLIWMMAQYETLALAREPATVSELGSALLKPYALAFELTSVLLLAAMIGAVVLARKERS